MFFLCRVIEVAFFKAVSKISLSSVTKEKLLHSHQTRLHLIWTFICHIKENVNLMYVRNQILYNWKKNVRLLKNTILCTGKKKTCALCLHSVCFFFLRPAICEFPFFVLFYD